MKKLNFIWITILIFFNHGVLFGQDLKDFNYIQKGINLATKSKSFPIETNRILEDTSNNVELILYGPKFPGGGNDFTWLIALTNNFDTVYKALFNHPYKPPKFELIQVGDTIVFFFEESSNWGTGQQTNEVIIVNYTKQIAKEIKLTSLVSSPNLCEHYFKINLQGITSVENNIFVKYKVSCFDNFSNEVKTFYYTHGTSETKENLLCDIIIGKYKGNLCKESILEELKELDKEE